MRIDRPPVSRATLAMAWRDVCFLSWRIDAQTLAARLPAGIEVDLFDGSAWVSVIPFRITNLRVRGIPFPLGFGNAPEINLRAYVRVADTPGIYFFSLDTASPLLVRSARITTGLPYLHARIDTSEKHGEIAYRSERRDPRLPGGGTFRASYVPRGDPAAATEGSLDVFLAERYRFFLRRPTGLYVGNVYHAPWQLERLEVGIERNTLGSPLGLELGAPDVARFARYARVRAADVARIV